MTKHPHTSVPLFDRVTIIGVGLLGASLGLALKQRGLARHITGVGRAASPSLQIAQAMGAIDASHTDPATGVEDSDLVVLCTPVRQFPEMLSAIAPALKPGALITDVGSTKQQVMQWAQALVPTGNVFVGSHPMAGSEQRGPEAAKPDLYEGALCFICGQPPSPIPNAPPSSIENQKSKIENFPSASTARIEALWQALGMRTCRIDAPEHDRRVAAISHLPHAAAFSLVTTAGRYPAALPAVAGGFIDSTRVASSDVTMWTDIFLTNQTAVTALLDQYIQDLTTLKQAIAAGDEAAIRQTLSSAKQTRDRLVQERKAATLPRE